MNIIIVSKKHGQTRTFSSLVPVLVLLAGLSLFGGVGYLGYLWGESGDNTVFDEDAVQTWQQSLAIQRLEVKNIRDFTDEQLQALTVRIGELQARLLRIDALGERLVKVAKLDEGEFDFSLPPAMGGPGVESIDEANYLPPNFVAIIDDLSSRIEDRELQLSVLESLLGDRKIQRDTFIAGRPILRGWMSSRYGYRTDPFNGRRAWHEGVDFAGKDGSSIVAVAAGVVTFSGRKSGYGLMVEINHSNGYSTRYAHARELVAKVGDIVQKGQQIALMGSTGRSTGPHVHFEVLREGKPQDPALFINRTADR